MGDVAKQKKELLEVTTTCVNCEGHLELNQRFCPNCGGKRMYNRLTWRNLFEDFVDRFLNIENAFLKTFLALFRHPEDVIEGYMRGMRKKYLPAFSYFAIAITVAGFASFIIKNWFMEDMIAAQTAIYANDDPVAELQKSFTTNFLNWMMDYQSVVYFSFIPLIAVMSRLVFWNYKRFNMVEHFVIYLYAYSHIAMIFTLLGLMVIWYQPLYQVFSFLGLPFTIIYIGYVLKRLFKLDSGALILKTALFGLVLCILLFLMGIATFIAGVLLYKSGALEGSEFVEAIEKQQAAKKAIKEAAAAVKDTIPLDSLTNFLFMFRL